MANEKERFEILLEKIEGNVKAVLDGHEILNNKIDNLDNKIEATTNELKQEIRAVHSGLKNEIEITAYALKDDISRIEKKLDDHMRQPAHI
ncbi:MAG: hypothetical protein PHH14_05165 [Candidatus Margulisbacteria bacterium]|nr:hypothetical protein [Candidatus Margulisiibacteriota bacterium]